MIFYRGVTLKQLITVILTDGLNPKKLFSSFCLSIEVVQPGHVCQWVWSWNCLKGQWQIVEWSRLSSPMLFCTQHLWNKWWKHKRYGITWHSHTHKQKLACAPFNVRSTGPSVLSTRKVARVPHSLIFISTHTLAAISTCAPNNHLAHTHTYIYMLFEGEIWLLTPISGPLLLPSRPSGCPIRRENGLLTVGILSQRIKRRMTADRTWHWG